jgi:hypothetical protein
MQFLENLQLGTWRIILKILKLAAVLGQTYVYACIPFCKDPSRDADPGG